MPTYLRAPTALLSSRSNQTKKCRRPWRAVDERPYICEAGGNRRPRTTPPVSARNWLKMNNNTPKIEFVQLKRCTPHSRLCADGYCDLALLYAPCIPISGVPSTVFCSPARNWSFSISHNSVLIIRAHLAPWYLNDLLRLLLVS